METLQTQQGRERHRILFADDHDQTRRLMAVLLTRAGYEVDAAPDGSTALRLFKQRPRDYDVLITDHEMPELDGPGLVENLREARFPGKIIVISGGLSFANAKAYAALHVDQILSKPITRNSLINAIRN